MMVVLVLLVLLVVHHPLMGLMPAMSATPPLSATGSMAATSMHGQPTAAAMTASDSIPMGTAGAASVDGHGVACPSCLETCLMHAVAPDRSTLRLASPPTWGPLPGSGDSALAARPSNVCVGDILSAGAMRRAPSARARRAILQVFLL
jgi:hypothetical protein